MRVYLDSSALIKRSLLEEDSPALIFAVERYLEAGAMLLTSTLGWIEVTRAIRSRLDSEPPLEVVDRVDVALSGITECPVTDEISGIARRLGPASLRSLDAIHLATAAMLDVDLVCAYDQRMLTAAAELGFRTVSPA